MRDAAGERFGELELHIQVTNVVITNDRQRGAATAAEQQAGLS